MANEHVDPTRETELIRADQNTASDNIEADTFLQLSHHAGPLPSSQELARYDDRFPGFGERIMRMAEKDQEHIIAIELEQLAMQNRGIEYASRDALNEHRRASQGQILGFILMLTVIGGGTVGICTGHDWAGATIITGTLGVLGYVFRTRYSKGEGEGEDKSKEKEAT